MCAFFFVFLGDFTKIADQKCLAVQLGCFFPKLLCPSPSSGPWYSPLRPRIWLKLRFAKRGLSSPCFFLLALFIDRSNAAGTSSRNTKLSAAATEAEQSEPAADKSPSKSPGKSYKEKMVVKKDGTGVNASPLSNNGVLVFVAKTKSGDMVMYLEKANDTAPFVYLTVDYMMKHMPFTRDTLNVHYVMGRVDPHDPQRYRTQFVPTNSGSYERRWSVFVHICAGGQESVNTAANRRRWAETFISFFNHPANQSKYTYPSDARFAGDVTPQDETNAPELSTYLTLRDTMFVLQVALRETEDGSDDKASIRSCLANGAAMRDYYRPEHLDPARTYFARFAYQAGNNDEESDPAQELEGLTKGLSELEVK